MERSFYEQDVVTVARGLLGTLLTYKTPEAKVSGVIIETEAYSGINDPACHAFPYKRTPRTEVLFGPGGYAYVYLIYGMYCCLNVTANRPGQPEAVLIRALCPVEGINIMARNTIINRRKPPEKTLKTNALCAGPGKLCVSMGIGKQHYGLDMMGDILSIRPYPEADKQFDFTSIDAVPRINIDYAPASKDWPWRFILPPL